MKISLNWLNSLLDQPVTAEEAERLLTQQGMPLDKVQSVGSDTMLDVEVTSNRSDCLSHLGVAREIAAGSQRKVIEPSVELPASQLERSAVSTLTAVDLQAPDLCPQYTARVIRGVHIAPSPRWLSERLQTIGLRSINNVVDVTNYVMMETGQPLHAFDMTKLAERRIVVRQAHEGEKFTAIDSSKHTLNPRMLVIADAAQPVAIAGIMGGLHSEVSSTTCDVLLESAQFVPLNIRRTSRALKLASDSSYRFERGLDPQGVARASQRAARLILELAGGKLAEGVVITGQPPATSRQVSMRVARCQTILGLPLPAERMIELFNRLSFSPTLDQATQTILCVVPTYRLDVEREIDLIEEVARLHGLDAMEVSDRIAIVAKPKSPQVAARQKMSQSLIAHGYCETITFSFVQPKLGQPFLQQEQQAVLIDDERRKNEPMLRPSVLPSLLACRKANQDAGNHDVKLFELANTWTMQAGAIVEKTQLALLCDAADEQLGLREMRGTLEELVHQLAGEGDTQIVAGTHPALTAAAELYCHQQRVGVYGLLAPAIRKTFELSGHQVLAELDWPTLANLYPPRRILQPMHRYPAVERDLSVIVADVVTWSQIHEQIQLAEPALLEQVQFLVTYRGKPIPTGQKSVSFRMWFRDPQATLRHEQVDAQVQTVMDKLKQTLGASVRT